MQIDIRAYNLQKGTKLNHKKLTISTLGSHCSLQLLKGAKDEGFRTLLISEEARLGFYQRFSFIDDIFVVKNFKDFLAEPCQQYLTRKNAILIPHGTLIAYLDNEQIESITVPIFGNRWILRWEADRKLKQRLMEESELRTPKIVESKEYIDKLCIVKLHGAAGGRGYFLAWNKESFENAATKLIQKKVIRSESDLYIQEYIIGVPVYLQFFYSPITHKLELMGVDRRYESDIDALARIPAQQQLEVTIEPSYNVIGNSPLVLRESLLPEVYSIGEKFVETTKRLVDPGIPGPFCIEGVYDRDGIFTAFEFSARIVAGTNMFLDGSPYSGLIFDKPMSMGRRIANEIKLARNKAALRKVLT